MIVGTCSGSPRENKLRGAGGSGSLSAQRLSDVSRLVADRGTRVTQEYRGSPRRSEAPCYVGGMPPELTPDYFTREPPPGLSRESGVRLDDRGRFWHEGELVTHARLNQALHRWIARHPTNGRYILNNDYVWLYLTVDDVPYFVRGVTLGEQPVLHLSDDTTEPFPLSGYVVGAEDALYCPVKAGAFEARFLPSAQNALGPLLEAVGDNVHLRVGSTLVPVGYRE